MSLAGSLPPLSPPPPPKRSPWISLALIIALMGVGGWFFFRPSSTDQTTAIVRFQVRKGASAHQISRDLADQGLLRYPWQFLVWVRILGHANHIKPGVYDLPRTGGGLRIYRMLRKGPPLIRITIPEGWTASQIALQLDAQGVSHATEFLALVNEGKHEGYLYPDTYLFEQETPPARIIARFRERFQERRPKDFTEQSKTLKLSEAQLVILASLVEKEARVPEERPIIAGVFLNRMRKHWLLESCATVQYAISQAAIAKAWNPQHPSASAQAGVWKTRLLFKDLDFKSPYNTYRNAGLPPGPICNPGGAALDAAIHPAQTDMMFFVADGQGTHQFSKYYKDHLAAKKGRRSAR